MPKVVSSKIGKGVTPIWPRPTRLPSKKTSTMHLKKATPPKKATKTQAACSSATSTATLTDALKDVPIASVEIPPASSDGPQPPAPFTIVELLTDILLCLPPADLLISQAVRKLWKAAIETNSDMQRKLFFQPPKQQVARFPVIRIPQNPFLTSHFEPNDIHFGLNSIKTNSVAIVINTKGILNTKSWPKAFLYVHASWKKMLLVEKPLAALHISEIPGNDGKQSVNVRCIEGVAGEGVRLGSVVRNMRAAKKMKA